MITIKNVSDSNIIIEKSAVLPGDTIEIPNETIKKYQKLIDNGLIKQEHNVVKRIEISDEHESEEYLRLKERLIPAFFALYMNTPLTEQYLEDLKWFYKNASHTSNIDILTKSLIDDVQDDEELKEVLLNHVYPQMLKSYFKKYES